MKSVVVVLCVAFTTFCNCISAWAEEPKPAEVSVRVILPQDIPQKPTTPAKLTGIQKINVPYVEKGRIGPPLPINRLPVNGRKKITLIYFSPKDRIPNPGTKERIQTIAAFFNMPFREAMVNEEIDEELKNHGLDFEHDQNGQLAVTPLEGKFKASYYRDLSVSQKPSAGKIIKEVRRFFPSERPLGSYERLLVIFADVYDERSPSGGEWRGGFSLGYTEPGVVIAPSWILRNEYSGASIDEQMAIFANKEVCDHIPYRGTGLSSLTVATMSGYGIGIIPSLIVKAIGGIPETKRIPFSMDREHHLFAHAFFKDPTMPNVRKRRFPREQVELLIKFGYLH